MDNPEVLTALFRREGLKVTPQRRYIFEILHAEGAHLTAETVYRTARERMPTISLKTVYETLHSLVALDQVRQIDLGTGSVWFDPDVRRHEHLVCSECAEITDIHLDIASIAGVAARDHGFVIDHSEVILRGLCSECAGAETAPPMSFGTGRRQNR